MSSYQSLAPFYDALTQDVDYYRFADFYEEIFRTGDFQVKTILDLACGTGSLSAVMAERGYEMISVDASAEMLSVAAEKFAEGQYPIRPMLLNQSMEELDLYGTVDACVCCLDSMNYVDTDTLREAFRRLMLFIRPGGVLIFDVNTPEKMRSLDSQVFVDETDDVYCVWRAEFLEEEEALFYGMDIFEANGDQWERSFEEHVEYLHTSEKLKEMLKKAGFTAIKITGELTMDAPKAGEQRIFVTAVRP